MPKLIKKWSSMTSGKYMMEAFSRISDRLSRTGKPAWILSESTDTWDSVDWLVKNVENNNGNVGIFGKTSKSVSIPRWAP
ncbi:MAG: hypothetical protein U0X39_14735 [Bacteroidales bacterium]